MGGEGDGLSTASTELSTASTEHAPEDVPIRTEYSLEEVSKHTEDEDLWCVIHDVVVKVPRSFLEDHPGGPEILQSVAGKDVSKDFEDISHSDEAREMIAPWVIGVKEGASDEARRRYMVPSAKDVLDLAGGGGSVRFMIPVLVLVLAGVCYFLFAT